MVQQEVKLGGGGQVYIRMSCAMYNIEVNYLIPHSHMPLSNIKKIVPHK